MLYPGDSRIIWESRYICIKRWGRRISTGYYECGPRLLSSENRRKIEPKEIPGWFIPRLFVVVTQQLEILVTFLVSIIN